jgi:hypothetical protein
MSYKDCHFNKNLESIIYHFSNQNLSDTENVINNITGKKIYYDKIDINDNIEKILDKLIKQCEKSNILIFVDSISEPKFIHKINIYLDKFNHMHSIFHNITIINYTNNNKNTIYSIKNKNNTLIFKKMVNVFPLFLEEPVFANDKDFFVNLMKNVNVQNKLDDNNDVMYTFMQKGGGIKDIIVRLMDTSSVSDSLKDQWWFQWYFDLPPCANVRLLQSSGTCWLNTAINSLFMNDKITQIFESRYKELSEIEKEKSMIKFRDYEKNFDLKNLLNSLVYNLLINKTKASNDDGNFLLHLARIIKCTYENKKFNCNNLDYGNGGDSSLAIKIICDNLLKKNDFLFIDIFEIVCEHYVNKYNKFHNKYSKKIEKYNSIVDEYNIETKKINKNNYKIEELKKKIVELEEKLNILEKKLEKYSKKIDKNKNKDITNIDIENDSYIKKSTQNINKERILCFKGTFTSDIKKEIILNNKKYKLYSSVISLADHYICGIICNDIEFIYDSNNIFIKSNWTEGEKGLKNYFDNKNVPKFYKFLKIYVLIYFEV